MKRLLVAAALAGAAGCGTAPELVDPCAAFAQTCIAVQVDPTPSVTRLDKLHFHVTGNNAIDKSQDSAPSAGGAAELPAAVPIVVGSLPGQTQVLVEIDGFLANASVGSAAFETLLENGQHVTVHVTLGSAAPDGGAGDGPGGPIHFDVVGAAQTGPNPTAVATGYFFKPQAMGGKIDLVVAASNAVEMAEGDVRLLQGNGMGGFKTGQPVGVGIYPAALAVADFNGDGLDDVAVADADPYQPGGGGDVQQLLNLGSGRLNQNAVLAKASNPNAVAAADFDGDGKIDLVVANTAASTISLLRGTGLPNQPFQPPLDVALPNRPTAMAIADLAGDKKYDVVVGDATGVSVLAGGADGGVLSAPGAAQPTMPVVALAPGRLGGGKGLDVAAATAASLILLPGDGMGGLAASRDLLAGEVRALAAADFDRDGLFDLAVGDRAGGTVRVLRQKMGGSFEVVYTVALDTPSALAVGDFDGDGRQDIAVTSFDANRVTILLNAS